MAHGGATPHANRTVRQTTHNRQGRLDGSPMTIAFVTAALTATVAVTVLDGIVLASICGFITGVLAGVLAERQRASRAGS